MAPLGLKLLKIYYVSKDASFLVDLCDDELNVENLISIIRERGKKLGYDFHQLRPFSEGALDKKDVQILVFGNIKLQSGRLPGRMFARYTRPDSYCSCRGRSPNIFHRNGKSMLTCFAF